MPNDHDIPVSRPHLLFTVEMALRKTEHLWPKRRRPGDHDRLQSVAEAVVDHLDLCGMRCFQKAPEYGEPHRFDIARRNSEDGTGGA